MFKLSLKVPNNEMIINPKDSDQEWQKYSEAVKKVPRNLDIPMIINGKKVFSQNKVKNLNPSNGEVIGSYQQADATHSQNAIDAALNAKENWASLSPATRIQKFRDLENILLKIIAIFAE